MLHRRCMLHQRCMLHHRCMLHLTTYPGVSVANGRNRRIGRWRVEMAKGRMLHDARCNVACYAIARCRLHAASRTVARCACTPTRPFSVSATIGAARDSSTPQSSSIEASSATNRSIPCDHDDLLARTCTRGGTFAPFNCCYGASLDRQAQRRMSGPRSPTRLRRTTTEAPPAEQPARRNTARALNLANATACQHQVYPETRRFARGPARPASPK